MPRSNRPRRPRGAQPVEPERDLAQVVLGGRRTETRSGRDWTVQPVSRAAATKEYRCPGCELVIAPGTAHVVAWRADGLFGEAADLAARRHWHAHCWRIA